MLTITLQEEIAHLEQLLLKSDIPVIFNIVSEETFSNFQFSVNGIYNKRLDKDGKIPVKIIIIQNGYPTLDDFLFQEIEKTLNHEYRHAYQYKKRNFLSLTSYSEKHNYEELGYYSNLDEIDAYSFETALSLKSISEIQYSDYYQKYKELFGVNSKEFRRFSKKFT